MTAASSVNDYMPRYIINRLTEKFDGDLSNTTVAVLGLAFKSETSDTRRSPAITLANLLVEKGAKVLAYDPQANEEAKATLNKLVVVTESKEDAVREAAVVVIATDWSEFKAASQWTPHAPKLKLVVDAVNCLDFTEVSQLDAGYIGVGRGQVAAI